MGNAFVGSSPRNVSSLDFTSESLALPRPACCTGPAGITHRTGHANQYKSWSFLPLPFTQIYSGSVPTPGNKGSFSYAVLESENTLGKILSTKNSLAFLPPCEGSVTREGASEVDGSGSDSNCWGLLESSQQRIYGEKAKTSPHDTGRISLSGRKSLDGRKLVLPQLRQVSGNTYVSYTSVHF